MNHEAEAKRPRLVPNQLGHLRRDCGPHLGRVGPVAGVQLVARELKAEDQGDQEESAGAARPQTRVRALGADTGGLVGGRILPTSFVVRIDLEGWGFTTEDRVDVVNPIESGHAPAHHGDANVPGECQQPERRPVAS